MSDEKKILPLSKAHRTAMAPAPLRPGSFDAIKVDGAPLDPEIDDAFTSTGGAIPFASRNHLQLPRRLFHSACGCGAAYIYGSYVTHAQAAQILGMFVSIMYILEQIRIKYPEVSSKIYWLNHSLLRAEERLKESSGFPYAMGVTLVILSFPKVIALIAILTIALADPLAAIVGITKGRRKISGSKTFEGSATFFTITLIITASMLFGTLGLSGKIFLIAPLAAATVTLLELIPMRIDDNLLIPLYSAFVTRVLCALFELPLV